MSEKFKNGKGDDLMNELQVFDYKGKKVRTVEKDGVTWWVLKDVCGVLAISKYRDTAARLDEDEREPIRVDTLGGAQEMICVNESGLYNVLLRSDKEEAKPFRKWVTSKVLPSIRKHGAYLTPEKLRDVILNPDTMIELCQALKDEQENNKRLMLDVERMKPKEIFADAVTTSEKTILIGELAKILKQNGADMGANRLFAWLREKGYLIKRKGTDWNAPTQKSMEMGLFEVKETAITHSDGHTSVSKTTKVTGKGQVYFINKFNLPALT